MNIKEFKQWWNRFEYSGNFPEPKAEHINLLLAEVNRLTADLAEKDAEIERLKGKIVIVEAESMTISEHLADADYDLSTTQEELKSWRKLAQARLADQEAIERHTRRETARECAEIAEAMWSDHYWAWPAMQTYAAEIRKKYGVE